MVELVSLAGVVTGALIGATVQLIKLRHTIGQPPDHQDLTHILLDITAGQAGQDVRIAAIEHRIADLYQKAHASIEEQIELRRHLDVIELTLEHHTHD